MNVGPFCTTGLAPVLQRLRTAFDSVKKADRTLWSQLGTAGSLCCRYIGGTTSYSNHAWGGAIDLKINGKLDPYNNNKVYNGLIDLYPHMHEAGFYWGAAFSREDGMHFEMSRQEIESMERAGHLTGKPKFLIADPSPIDGCKYPVVRKVSPVTKNDLSYALQAMLKYHCYSITVDGLHGSGTESVVKQFQTSRGLSADGVVGMNTWSRLHVDVEYLDEGSHVVAVNRLLSKYYSAVSSTSSSFGSTTRSYVRRFQSDRGLQVTGVVDLATFQALLGDCNAYTAPAAAATPTATAAPSESAVPTASTTPTPTASASATPAPTAAPAGCPQCPQCPEAAPAAEKTSGDDTLLSIAQLKCAMPSITESRLARYIDPLNIALYEGQITSPLRIAAFLAQIAHESGELRWWSELGSCDYLEGRRDLGNVNPGDGCKYKGRGPLQLTGRSNYASAERDLNAAGKGPQVDLVNNPEQVAQPDAGFRTAVWFWGKRRLNSYADQGNFDAITYRVNGGYNGKASRDRYYTLALGCLGGSQVPVTSNQWSTLRRGATGYEVAALQYLLAEHSAGSCTPNGSFDDCTDRAVRTFQRAKSLSVDGVVGPMTWEKVVITVRRSAPTKLAVMGVQFLLKEKFSYSLTVDGLFGSGTESAVKNYQDGARLQADGVVGTQTWSNLISNSGSSARAYSFANDGQSAVYVTEEEPQLIEVNPVANTSEAAVDGTILVDTAHPGLGGKTQSGPSKNQWIIIVACTAGAMLVAGALIGVVVGKKMGKPSPPARGAVQLNEVNRS
eukprot:TRINITY_DN643_c1_g1_i2.p1 TRINITY_DN643_c1_g1~~TRINITY_DN643_c1_g1_i2.p1  ORF type:complete len:868 (+),score=229.84 TRINITY_DN643_c1_g1_i2:250-2604(+)